MKYKKCGKCKKSYPATTEYYHKDKYGKFGLNNWCKTCRNKKRRERYLIDKSTGKAKKYYEKNKLKHKVNRMNKRAYPKISIEDVERIMEKFKDDNDVLHCAYCNRAITQSSMLQLDHIIPVSNGGTNSSKNIVPTCKYCNRSKLNENFTSWYKQQFFYNPERETQIVNKIKSM